MNFYDLLKACYRDEASPFALYSQMCDLCKGDLKLKAKVELLYEVYRKRDIFKEIAACDDGAGVITCVQSYSSSEQSCLWDVARLLRPEWGLSAPVQSESAKKVKVPQRKVSKQVVHQKGFQGQAGALVAPARNSPAVVGPTPAKKRLKGLVGAETLYISNMLSDLTIQTSASVVDFSIRTLQNGVWTTRVGGVGKHGMNVYINLDGIVAESIVLLLPQKKYATLYVDKVSGELWLEDQADCFDRINVTLASGKLYCEASARTVYIGGRATDIELSYTAIRCGNVEIKNTLGDVRIALNNVGVVQEKLVAVHGSVKNAYSGINGKSLLLKVVTDYGNVEIA